MERTCKWKLNWIKWTVIAALLVFASARIYYALTDDFRLSNITYPVPYEKNWEIAGSSPEEKKHLKQILDQPFYYLGKGAQSYAFVSKDDKYVLKFFKFKHLRPSLFVDALPSVGLLKRYKEKQIARKERKLFGVFRSYKLAYDVEKNESGLIFIQLNSEDNPKRYATIIDKIGFKRVIDLHNYPFILQIKGETLRVVVNDLLKKGNIAEVEKRLGQMLELYAGEYRRGIYDHDHGVMQNTGFIGDRPFHLDVGKLMREEKMRDQIYAKQDAEVVAGKINEWVKKNYPQYSLQIAGYLNEKIRQLYTGSL